MQHFNVNNVCESWLYLLQTTKHCHDEMSFKFSPKVVHILSDTGWKSVAELSISY